jgi:hypothetical protein
MLYIKIHLMSRLLGYKLEFTLPTTFNPPSGPILLLLAFGNIFQNLNLSSPAPVTIELPSGFIAKYKTLNVCPVSVAIFSIVGYFHTIT